MIYTNCAWIGLLCFKVLVSQVQYIFEICFLDIKIWCTYMYVFKIWYIVGLKEICVQNADEAYKLLTIGKRNLQTACTKLNHQSSRR